MSSPSGAARTRSPRIAEAAVERARLAVVPRTLSRPPQIPFAVLMAVALIGGVVGLLMFNTNMAAASFHATALQQRLTGLQAREDKLNLELDRLRDPQRLARRAKAMGMVPLGAPSFVRLSNGQVLGHPQVAHRLQPKSSASASAGPSTGPSAAPSPAASPSATQPTASPTSDGTTSTTGKKKKASQ